MDLILRRNLLEPTVAGSLVLRRNHSDETPSVSARLVWRYADDPTMKPQRLGSTKAGSVLETPFNLEEGRQIKISLVSKTAKGTESVANIDNAPSVIFPSGPTFTSAVYDTGDDVDLVFAKNSAETGNIKVEYRRVGDEAWLLHGTDFAHSATSGTIAITQLADNADYQIRLRQEGIVGYSVTLGVTVIGTGADDTPTNLDAVDVDIGSCAHEVTLTWTYGTGAGTHFIERKIGSGSFAVLEDPVTSPYVDTVYGSPTTSKNYTYRVKQSDVDGYSNTSSVYIARCFEEL